MSERLTNKEFAAQLRRLADKWETLPEMIPRPFMRLYCYTKDEARTILRAFGGHFSKSTDGEEYMIFTHETGLSIQLPRSSVCKRIVTWDCQPLLSPEEEAEFIEEAK
jgi:hypothetical protein